MKHGGKHADFEQYLSFRMFEDEIVDCGMFSEEYKERLLTLVENCMKHAYQRGTQDTQCSREHTCQLKESSNTSSDQPIPLLNNLND